MAERKSLKSKMADAIERESEDLHTTAPRVLQQRPKRLRNKQAKRKKVNWEVDADVATVVQQIAEALEISPAAAATRLIFDGLERYAAGEIDFEGYLQPSRSPRYRWVVEVNAGDRLESAIADRLSWAPISDGEG